MVVVAARWRCVRRPTGAGARRTWGSGRTGRVRVRIAAEGGERGAINSRSRRAGGAHERGAPDLTEAAPGRAGAGGCTQGRAISGRKDGCTAEDIGAGPSLAASAPYNSLDALPAAWQSDTSHSLASRPQRCAPSLGLVLFTCACSSLPPLHLSRKAGRWIRSLARGAQRTGALARVLRSAPPRQRQFC